MAEAQNFPDATHHQGVPGTEPRPSYLRFAILLIIGMGVLIVVGFGFIGVELYRRSTDPDYHARRRGGEAAVVPPAAATTLMLPEGSRITEQSAVGNRLAIRVDAVDGSQVLYLLTPGEAGRFDIQEAIRTPPHP